MRGVLSIIVIISGSLNERGRSSSRDAGFDHLRS